MQPLNSLQQQWDWRQIIQRQDVEIQHKSSITLPKQASQNKRLNGKIFRTLEPSE